MKKTIAFSRAAELAKLTANYTHNSAIYENLMNRFYRICGALNRLLILENAEATATESGSYTQYCYNIDYLNGWLYGAVQAVNGIMKPINK